MGIPPVCSLTFDDGPDPVWTPRVLDSLRHDDARSTFFVMASRASEHPALIERMFSEGHEVGFHCVEHVRHSDLDEAALRRDTEMGLRVLGRLGAQVRLWRPPWGVVTPETRRVCADYGLKLAAWSVDPEDWAGDVAAEMHDRVAGRICAGAVVLLHDGLGPGARRSDCRQTVDLIPRLVETIGLRGLRTAPFSESSR